MNIKKKQYIFYFLVILILGVFFYFYNYLNIHNSSQPLIFNSPDETANYYFSKTFATNGQLRTTNNLLDISSQIHPRSISVYNNYLIPSSFTGISLIYGGLAKIFGIWIIIYLTPLISIIGLIFFYLLVKEIFDKKTALISAFMLLILPSYWYFSTRVMMHNILFIDLLIISLYFIIRGIKKNRFIYYLFSVLFLSLSLLVRSSEITWVIILFLSLIIIFRKKIEWKKLILSYLIFLVFIVAIIRFNMQNYGSAISGAYLNNTNTQSLNILYYLKKIFIPFGFHPRNIRFVVFNFIFKLIWWHNIALLLSLGFIFIKRKNFKKKQYLYLISWLGISIFLFIYYGSWLFFDNPNPKAITIGSSYLRYMLPYFVFGIPIIAWSLNKIKFSKKRIDNLFIVSILAFMFLNSYLIVMKCPQEGIIKISQDLNIYQKRTKLIKTYTAKNSIIISSRADKYIFPYRHVFYSPKEINQIKGLKNLIQQDIPIYYFGFKFDDEDFQKVKGKLNAQNIKLSNPIFIDDDHALYRIKAIN